MEGLYTGTLAEGISTTMYNGTQGYDKNGNIGYLKRTSGSGATVMDELIYSYTANQLTAVADGGDATKGFKDKVNSIDYTYDQAGNMITDANKDLSITYNHLNLPASITRNTLVGSSGVENNGIIKHYYAGATKVRIETYSDQAGTVLTKAYDYLAGMVYQETVTTGNSTKELDFVASPEGRALLTKKVLNLTTDPTTGDKFRFEYSLKDHLGNLRVSCRCGEPKRDAQGIIIPEGTPGTGIEPLAIVQEQHYDAWGLAFSSVSSSEVENLQDRFKYNSKELLTDLDLGWNDYGARMYMSEIGRWNGVDPLAGKYLDISPYAFVKNNPINNREIDGRYFDEKNEKKAHKIEGKIDKQIAKLDKQIAKLEKQGKDIRDRRERIAELRNSKTDITDMRGDATTEYRYGSLGSKEAKGLNLAGPTTLSTGTNAKGDGVVTMFSENNMGSTLHEQRHGGQNARNEFNIATGANYGVADEINAYRVQYAWDGKLEYRDQPAADVMLARLRAGQDPTKVTLNNINQITGAAVNAMVDPGFIPIYPPRDAAGNLIIPLVVWNRN